MRTVRAVRARVPAESRAEYLDLLARWQEACAESARVKGFYVMESTETPGDFLEFLEFADEAAADAFGEELREAPHRAILGNRAAGAANPRRRPCPSRSTGP